MANDKVYQVIKIELPDPDDSTKQVQYNVYDASALHTGDTLILDCGDAGQN